MEIVLRKCKDNTVVVLPTALLETLGITTDQPLTLDVTQDGRIVLSKVRKPSLEQLIDMCDTTSPEPADLALWDMTSTRESDGR